MKSPAHIVLVVLAFAAAVQAAAASDRFVPTDPDFVVARLRNPPSDPQLRRHLAEWRADPFGVPATALATLYLQRARAQREPALFGRAEAVLAPVVRDPRATHDQMRLYAETLQYRHDFAGAAALLDAVLAQDPRDAAARIARASVRLVRGEFAAARVDCAQLLARGDAAASVGLACLAEALAGSGELGRARTLLSTWPVSETEQPAARAYLLAVRGELAERAGSSDAAIADYALALTLAPADDSIRAALVDVLAARGDIAQARELAGIERPSLALLTRAALLAPPAQSAALAARARAWLDLEKARGDVPHNREAALLALAAGDAPRALAAALANFTVQRELADVRVLARAAVAARSVRAVETLRAWLDATAFADVVTYDVLAGADRANPGDRP